MLSLSLSLRYTNIQITLHYVLFGWQVLWDINWIFLNQAMLFLVKPQVGSRQSWCHRDVFFHPSLYGSVYLILKILLSDSYPKCTLTSYWVGFVVNGSFNTWHLPWIFSLNQRFTARALPQPRWMYIHRHSIGSIGIRPYMHNCKWHEKNLASDMKKAIYALSQRTKVL